MRTVRSALSEPTTTWPWVMGTLLAVRCGAVRCGAVGGAGMCQGRALLAGAGCWVSASTGRGIRKEAARASTRMTSPAVKPP